MTTSHLALVTGDDHAVTPADHASVVDHRIAKAGRLTAVAMATPGDAMGLRAIQIRARQCLDELFVTEDQDDLREEVTTSTLRGENAKATGAYDKTSDPTWSTVRSFLYGMAGL